MIKGRTRLFGHKGVFMSEAGCAILPCPICGQQLRVPTDRGNLQLTCPRCRHCWDWATPSRDDLSRFEAHFAVAEGSQIQRGCIAAAMLALEDGPVQRQRIKLSAEHQLIFMMTYECFVMWAFKQGLETVLKRDEVELTVVAMQRHFAKHASYQPDAFERIWDQMQRCMPMAYSGEPYPVVDMLMAPTLAGFPLDPMIGADLEFGIYVGLAIGDCVRAARAQAMPIAPR